VNLFRIAHLASSLALRDGNPILEASSSIDGVGKSQVSFSWDQGELVHLARAKESEGLLRPPAEPGSSPVLCAPMLLECSNSGDGGTKSSKPIYLIL
jgi:hypothetical protein